MLSSLLIFWDLVLNFKCPNKCVFYCFYGLICDFHEFPSVKSSKFSQHIASCGTRILNTKKVGFVKTGFSIFANLRFLPLRKNWFYRFPEKRAPTKVKYLLPISKFYEISPKETRENSLSDLLVVLMLT